ncbi:MAG: tetratricopeptide repeat protein [Opitutales bacterium]|nr:tetratricopeptide repeat protein [Opitutales bacterium]
MKFSFLFLSLSFLITFPSFLQSAPSPRRPGLSVKEYTFPGTGFFVKDRTLYSEKESKRWFLQAQKFQKEGSLRKALGLYEKFAKRRSDAMVSIKGEKISVGAESLYQASILREKKGDWQRGFEHLQLLAKAYTSYDFERVAESLMRLAERLAKDDLPRKWGIFPRFRSGSQDRIRLDEIANLARGPRFAPRALMALAEIALKDDKEEEAVDALERIVNLYPENYMSEKAYFMLAKVYEDRVSGPAYDQGSTLKALNFYEDYLILYAKPPAQSIHESVSSYRARVLVSKERFASAELGRNQMRQILAESKLEVAQYIEKYGKYFLVRWRELGNRPALQFYNEAINSAPESDAARIAEKKVAELRAIDEK